MEPSKTVLGTLKLHRAGVGKVHLPILTSSIPRPRVSKPDRRQDMYHCVLVSPVRDGDLYKNVLNIVLRILDENVEVFVMVKNSGIQKLELPLVFSSIAVLFDQTLIRERGLRILVQVLHVR